MQISSSLFAELPNLFFLSKLYLFFCSALLSLTDKDNYFCLPSKAFQLAKQLLKFYLCLTELLTQYVER